VSRDNQGMQSQFVTHEETKKNRQISQSIKLMVCLHVQLTMNWSLQANQREGLLIGFVVNTIVVRLGDLSCNRQKYS